MNTQLTSRERILTAISHREPDRVSVHDSPWGATVARWRKEGLPEHESAESYFGYEMAGFSSDLSPRYETEVIFKDDNYIVERNSWGGVRKNHRDYSTTPEIVDYPVKSEKDWRRIKKRLEPDYTRVDWASSLARFRRARKDGKFTFISAALGYDLLQTLVRTEELLVMMAERPGFFKDMVDTNANLFVKMAGMMIEKGIKADAVWDFNDMGYRNATLFSPQMYRELIFPADKKICDAFHRRRMKTILHSCGNVKGIIPDLIEAGFDVLQPLEVKAGMDLRELKQKFGDSITLFGGIDVRLMEHRDPSRIEEEIKSKFKAAMPGGGFIYHSDHSIPKDVSFQQYCFVMECVKKYGTY